MCGIVGYIGKKKAASILLDGLQKLEYRGYDSAGIAVLDDKGLSLNKTVGKLQELRDKLGENIPEGNMGIGHTRWATHGKPSYINSHPHTGNTEDFIVVHNGIIENYQELKKWLIEKGHTFKSETDTEVLPHLIEYYYDGDIVKTIQKIAPMLEGSYALGIITIHEKDKIVVVRKDSPLVIGLGEGEYFIASDIPAILPYTRDTYILDNGEMAVLTANSIELMDIKGNKVEKEVFHVKWDMEAAERGGYDHFMLKEIHEQPKAIRETITGRISDDDIVDLELKLTDDEIKEFNKVVIVACGTSYHAGLVGKYLIEKLLRIPVEVDVASEFRYRDPIIDEKTLVIVISQSGETADTLAGLKEAKAKKAKIVAITNVVGSSVTREAHEVIYTWAGPEIAVASTKAYVTQLIALYLLTMQLAQVKKVVPAEKLKEIAVTLKEIPEKAEEILAQSDVYDNCAKKMAAWNDTFFIGRGLDYAVALEGSLKLKEISYIHAEAYAAGELKHGTLALIEENIPVIALVTQTDVYDKTMSNVIEVKARGAYVTGIAFEGNEKIKETIDEVIYIPKVMPLMSPVLSVIPLQLLSYYAAVARGNDVDKPRNLAKSVTVE